MKYLPLLLLTLVLVLPSPARAQSLGERLVNALERDNPEEVLRQVRAHRLDIKPVVDSLLHLALKADRAGERAVFERALTQAADLAGAFAQTFGESSLSMAVDLTRGWSSAERRIKLRADSLEARGTALRSAAATREESLALYQEAVSLYEQIGDLGGIALARGGIGFLHWYLDRSRYLALNLQALEARVRADDRQLVGNSLYDVGLAYQYVERDADQALRYYRRSDSVRVAIGDSLALNRMLPAVASLYRSMGDLPTARRFYDRAIAAHERAGDTGRLAISERNQGVLLSEMGFHSEALRHLQRARAVYEAEGDEAEVVPVISWIGVVHRRLGDYDAAIEAYQLAIELAQKADNPEWLADAYNNLGVVFAYADRYDRAAGFYRRALEQFRSVENSRGTLDATLNIADSYFELKDYAQAEAFGNGALALADSLGDPIRVGRALGTLASVYARSGRLEQSGSTFDRLLGMAKAMSMPELEAGALMQRAELEAERGEVEAALSHYQLAFDALERTRSEQETDQDRAGYLAQQRYAYEEFTHFLAQQYKLDPDGPYMGLAFEFAERGKARAFLDLLAEALSGVQQGLDPQLKARQTSLVESINSARQAAAEGGDGARLDSLEASYDQLKRDIREANPRYGALQYPMPSTLSEVQGRLDPGTLLLEYAVGDSSTTLIAVTRSGASMYSLPGREEVEQRVELLRFALTNPERVDAAGYAANAHALYQMLLGPAHSLLTDYRDLIVVPDGILHYVPFEALVGSPAGTGFDDLDYLVRSHVLRYSPSASVLMQLEDAPASGQRDKRKDLLAVGDPAFSAASQLARLPFSGAEVGSIAGMFGADRTDVLVSESASEDGLKLALATNGYRYVHLATHGLVNEDRPDFSGIALALGSGDNDGFLQAAEVFDLRIDADLVVLSACETGLGQMVRGEGLVGLTRAFMYAGAPSVVVSLWSVADQSTASLMERFYAGLAGGDARLDAALTDAKKQMVASATYAHPFHWAPFVLIGRAGS